MCFSVNVARSKSKKVAIRTALPSLWRTGTNGTRELTDIYVPRGSLNATATDGNNGLYNGGIRVSCVGSDHRGILYESGITSIGTGRDIAVVLCRISVASLRTYNNFRSRINCSLHNN